MNSDTVLQRLASIKWNFTPEDIEAGFRQAELHGFANIYDYKSSDAWYKKREEMKKLMPCVCVGCDGEENLHLHHKRYCNLCEETPEDVCWVCWKCHMRCHDGIGEYKFWISENVTTLKVRSDLIVMLKDVAEKHGYGAGWVACLRDILDYAQVHSLPINAAN